MIKDFKGNEFASLAEMCSKYGITKKIYTARINAGMDIKTALTSPVSESSPEKTELRPMADRIYMIRRELNMNRSEFGKYLGSITEFNSPLSLMMVSGTENVRTCFDMEVYIALAIDRNISLDYIFGRTENKEPYNKKVTYKTMFQRVKDVCPASLINEMPKLRDAGTEAKYKIAELLNVPLDYLCGLTDEKIIHK